jgi:hypothetical protein
MKAHVKIICADSDECRKEFTCDCVEVGNRYDIMFPEPVNMVSGEKFQTSYIFEKDDFE